MSSKSTASAKWNGTLIEGRGAVSTASSAMKDTPITWKARTGGEAGTTPEELLAAAHASCFSMALSGALAKSGYEVTSLETDAEYTFGEDGNGGFKIHGAHLTVDADIAKISDDEFATFAEGAKSGCPVSKALAGIEITMDAKLAAHV